MQQHQSQPPGAVRVPPVERKYRGMRQAIRVEAGMLVTVASFLVLLELGLIAASGLGGVLALVLALSPVPALFALGLWLDRFEPEPVWLLTRLFLWGATAAILVAGLLNTATAVLAGEFVAAVVSAPLVEEAMKGLALLWVLRRRPEHFTGTLDAIIYALFVGLGFAVVENVTYYAAALAEEGAGGLAAVVVVRGVLTPFLHPFFTMFTALGIVRGLHRRGRGRNLPAWAGYAAAVFLHALWNSGIGMVLYPIAFVPGFIFVVRRVLRHRRAEADLLARELEPELRSGVLTPEQHQRLRDAPLDLRSFAAALGDRDHPMHAWRRLHHAAFTLAAFRRSVGARARGSDDAVLVAALRSAAGAPVPGR